MQYEGTVAIKDLTVVGVHTEGRLPLDRLTQWVTNQLFLTNKPQSSGLYLVYERDGMILVPAKLVFEDTETIKLTWEGMVVV